MRPLFIAWILCAALISVPHILAAAENEKPPIASSYGEKSPPQEQQPFRLIILGTRSGPDIELIRKSMEKVAYVSLFVPSSVSQ